MQYESVSETLLPHFCTRLGIRYIYIAIPGCNICMQYCFLRHSDEMIKRLETAGLGFYVRTNETQQRLGTNLYTICDLLI